MDYFAQGETRTEKLHTVGEELPRSDEENQKQVIRMQLQIPSYPPSDETTCGLIKIKYYIFVRIFTCIDIEDHSIDFTLNFFNSLFFFTQITAHMEPPKIHLPITIGTKAIDNFATLDALDEHNTPGSDNSPSQPPPSAPVITTQPSAQPSA